MRAAGRARLAPAPAASPTLAAAAFPARVPAVFQAGPLVRAAPVCFWVRSATPTRTARRRLAWTACAVARLVPEHARHARSVRQGKPMARARAFNPVPIRTTSALKTRPLAGTTVCATAWVHAATRAQARCAQLKPAAMESTRRRRTAAAMAHARRQRRSIAPTAPARHAISPARRLPIAPLVSSARRAYAQPRRPTAPLAQKRKSAPTALASKGCAVTARATPSATRVCWPIPGKPMVSAHPSKRALRMARIAAPGQQAAVVSTASATAQALAATGRRTRNAPHNPARPGPRPS
jgi:hypothetical protein